MSYKKFDQADLEVIKNIIKDDERILYAENINEEYSHDELGGAQSYPDVVVKATSAEEISEIMKYAYENNIPVTPRGAGTGLVGSSVAIEHGIMIDSSLMNHILELDEENLTITVEPGVLLMELAATLKLLPLPKKAISLLIPFKTLKEAIDTVPLIIKSKAIPTAIEFMQREVIIDAEEYLGKKFPDSQSDAYLLLKFDGNSIEEIEADYDKVAKLCLEAGALDVLISDTEEREESIWKARGAFLEAIKGSTTDMDEVDMVVPRNKVNEMVEYLHNLHNEVDIRIKSFGHAGDGNLHSYILKDDLSQEEFEKRMAEAMEKIYEKAAQLGGKVSGEHGIGFAKKPYLRESLDSETVELMSGIKKAFDPKNILNPHKVFQS